MRGRLLGLALGLLWGCAECEDDFDCPGAQICVDGECATAVCRNDDACAPGQRCQNNACVAQPPIPAPPARDALVIGFGR